MSHLRLDPLTRRWVVISTDRFHRPQPASALAPAAAADQLPCPFCPGNEDATPPALETYGPTGRWLVRVVPNLYPAFAGREPMKVQNIGPVFTQAPASGIHEVLVLSPGHDDQWADLPDSQTALVLAAIRDRFEAHASVEGLRYSQAIVNCGLAAGASLHHPHGQLLGLPFVPSEIRSEQASFGRFAGACLLCTALEAEEADKHRVVHTDDEVVVVCPFWSGTPYEMLVLPRHHDPHLYRSPQVDLEAVGRAIGIALAGLRRVIGPVAYNIVFHSAPYRATGDYHWHVHLLPKVTSLAGFELGTGVLINVVAPEQAASEMRAAGAGRTPAGEQ